jgi:hypothetical protein
VPSLWGIPLKYISCVIFRPEPGQGSRSRADW